MRGSSLAEKGRENNFIHRFFKYILIPAELFKILKDDAIKVLHSICQQIWKTQQWPQNWKRLIFIQIPKKGSTKECTNYQTIAHPNAYKVMLKILQARHQYYFFIIFYFIFLNFILFLDFTILY